MRRKSNFPADFEISIDATVGHASAPVSAQAAITKAAATTAGNMR